MNISNATELMYNQKNSVEMAPDLVFKVMQTQEGSSLHFSIGTDNILYCTREVAGDVHGWSKMDLSSSLGGTAKLFDIAQDLSAGKIDMALVVTIDGKDVLHVSSGNGNTDADWAGTTPKFTPVAFDDPDPTHDYIACPINDIYLDKAGETQFLMADIVTGTFISRYYVDATGTVSAFGNSWIPRDLSANLLPGKITNIVGCRAPDTATHGIYTMGNIAYETEIIYEPMYNEWDPTQATQPTRISMPTGYTPANTAMAISKPNGVLSDLFLITNSSLYFVANADQTDLCTPTLAFTHPLFAGITSLHVDNDVTNNNLVLWGQTTVVDNGVSQNQIFVMECLVGSELTGATPTTNGTAWSCPIPILFDVVDTASYAKNGVGYSIIFAHINDGTNPPSLTQLTHDPITTAWQQRSILLPAPAATSVAQPYETVSYTTHIIITDDNNVVQQNYPVSIAGSSPCNVYINDIYTPLSTTAITVNTDNQGEITIMQPVDTVGGVCYNVTVDSQPVVNINPLTNPMNSLTATTLDTLNGNVTDEFGTSTPLITSTTVTAQQKTDTITNIGLIGQSIPSLPTNGDIQPTQVTQQLAINHTFNPAVDKIAGISFAKNNQVGFSGVDDMAKMGVVLNADNTLSLQTSNGLVNLSLKSIEAKAGHIYKWIKKEAAKVDTVLVTIDKDVNNVLNDVNHFFITIAGDVYHFVIKCYNDVVNSIHTLLNALEVAFEDMVKWIGFIFDYNDILRTHAVTKNILLRSIQYASTNVEGLNAMIATSFNTLENDLNSLVGLPVINDTPNTTSAKYPAPASSQTPQAKYGSNQLKNNGSNANSTITPTDTGADPTNGKLSAYQTFIEGEKDTLENLVTNAKAIADDYQTLTVSQIFEQLGVTVADFLLGETKTIITSSVDIIADLIPTAESILTNTIDIPVLSWLYKKMTKGSSFDLLDLCCLVTAIPATIVYKALDGSSPFPDDALTSSLIEAPDLQTIAGILNPALTTSVGSHGGGTFSDNAAFNTATKIANISAMVGSVGISVLSTLKSGILTTLKDNKWINAANTGFYLLYVFPDLLSSIPQNTTPGHRWDVYMNNWCTWLCISKTLVDMVAGFNELWALEWGAIGPWVDFGLNITWQAPTLGVFWYAATAPEVTLEAQENAIVNLIGGTAFDCSGVMSPALATAQDDYLDPDGKAAIGLIMAGISLFNVIWGVGCILDSYGPFKTPPSTVAQAAIPVASLN